MTKEELNKLTDQELQRTWNKVSRCLDNPKTAEKSLPGILQLARETDRRGLDLGQNKFGQIILEPKKQTA